ncbi:MAG: hypothetical protein PHU04_00735 [Candidatus Peribacteraceae bacterium]|nr:hypothetical protein [Candidatus Peribacteraceae bacterium]
MLAVFKKTFQPLILLQTVQARARYFYLSILLAALAGFFSFIEMMLLMKLVQGIISGDFSAITRVFQFRFIPPAFSFSAASYSMVMIVYVTIFFLFAIFTSVLSYASALSIEYQIQSADRNLRSMVFSRFLQFGKQYYDKKGLPGLQAILLRHTRLLAEQLRSYHQMLSKLFLLLAYLTVLFLLFMSHACVACRIRIMYLVFLQEYAGIPGSNIADIFCGTVIHNDDFPPISRICLRLQTSESMHKPCPVIVDRYDNRNERQRRRGSPEWHVPILAEEGMHDVLILT